MTTAPNTVFDRHPRATVISSVVLACVLLLIGAELLMRHLFGLGNPVIYDSSPLYGYRPLPNQERIRFGGARVHINNLGLRADQDWDVDKKNKILFLGDSVTFGGSAVDNDQLFSRRATALYSAAVGEHYIDGNVGVNAWGVLNIQGLLLDAAFQPAALYVTTLPEADFYRGLTRMQGLPFFNVSPRYAFAELWYFFCEKQNEHRYLDWTASATAAQKRVVLAQAVSALKNMDEHLRAQGYRHIVFITPTQQQVFDGAAVDPLIKELLDQSGLQPVYILDDLRREPPAADQRTAYYRDDIHLQPAGHQRWAAIMSAALTMRFPHAAP